MNWSRPIRMAAGHSDPSPLTFLAIQGKEVRLTFPVAAYRAAHLHRSAMNLTGFQNL